MNYAFYSSGNAGRLRNIIKKDDPSFLAKVKLVVIDNLLNGDIKLSLDKYGVSFLQRDYNDLGQTNSEKKKNLSNLILSKLVEFKIDYLFCFGDHILYGELLTKYKHRIINFHPSVLPLFPGRFAIDQALNSNSILLGNTAHFIDEGIDTGPIILQTIVHRTFFVENGYEGILDIQLEMLEKIRLLLELNKITVVNNMVYIEESNPNRILTIPSGF